jgi:DNA-binding MarR family transcriptional regulator
MDKSSSGIRTGVNTPVLREFRRNLRALEREIAFALDEQSRCCGVSVAQCHLLLELETMGAASIGKFATSLDLDPSTLSRTADGLVKLALISRVDDSENRRRQILNLKPKGHDVVYRINALCDAYYDELLELIPGTKRKTVFESLALLAGAMMERRKATAPESGCREAILKGSLKEAE